MGPDLVSHTPGDAMEEEGDETGLRPPPLTVGRGPPGGRLGGGSRWGDLGWGGGCPQGQVLVNHSPPLPPLSPRSTRAHTHGPTLQRVTETSVASEMDINGMEYQEGPVTPVRTVANPITSAECSPSLTGAGDQFRRHTVRPAPAADGKHGEVSPTSIQHRGQRRTATWGFESNCRMAHLQPPTTWRWYRYSTSHTTVNRAAGHETRYPQVIPGKR